MTTNMRRKRGYQSFSDNIELSQHEEKTALQLPELSQHERKRGYQSFSDNMNSNNSMFQSSDTPPVPWPHSAIIDVKPSINWDKKLHYFSYLGNMTKQSLLKDLVSWNIKVIKLTIKLIISLIFSPFIFILLLLYVKTIWHFLGYYTLYLFMVMIMPSLYLFYQISFFVHFDDTLSYRIDEYYEIHAYYSILPLFLSVLFKDAIVYVSNFKYNVEEEKKNKFKYIESIFCCGLNQRVIARLQEFIQKYRLWGETLTHYKPFQGCLLSAPPKYQGVSVPFKKLIPNYKEIKLYNEIKLEKYFRYTMITLSVLFCLSPTIYVFYKSLISFNYYQCIFAFFGFVFLCLVSTAINGYIEIIFGRLCEYYLLMKAMANLIEINPYQIFDDNNEFSRNILFEEMDYESKRKTEKKIWLYDDSNYVVWFENWCRIEYLTTTYFENNKSIVFATLASLLACITCLLYYHFQSNTNMINTMTISVGSSFIYYCVVAIRLLVYALKFSSLQKRQIQLIKIQQTYFKHLLLHPQLMNGDFTYIRTLDRNQGGNICDNDKIKLSYMGDIVQHIEIRSLSPKIGGITLNDALVYSTYSSLAGLGIAVVTYVLKHY